MRVQDWIDTCGPILVRSRAVAQRILELSWANYWRGDRATASRLRSYAYNVENRATRRVEALTRKAGLLGAFLVIVVLSGCGLSPETFRSAQNDWAQEGTPCIMEGSDICQVSSDPAAVFFVCTNHHWKRVGQCASICASRECKCASDCVWDKE